MPTCKANPLAQIRSAEPGERRQPRRNTYTGFAGKVFPRPEASEGTANPRICTTTPQ